MGRIHFYELHELDWFPHLLRRYVTDTLRFFWEFRIPLLQPQSAADVAADELARAMAARRTNSIVDVCSGGGGPVDAIQQRLVDRGVDARFTLTDLFPNVEAYRMLHARNRAIGFISEPVDATNCDLRGFRTMFASFHHFKPQLATRLLADAVTKGQGIAIFEVTRNSLLLCAIYALLLPILALLAAVLGRPRCRLAHLFFCFVFPVIPFVLLFDGTVSNLRTYSQAELRALTREADPDARFQWEYRERPLIPLLPIRVMSFVGLPRQG